MPGLQFLLEQLLLGVHFELNPSIEVDGLIIPIQKDGFDLLVGRFNTGPLLYLLQKGHPLVVQTLLLNPQQLLPTQGGNYALLSEITCWGGQGLTSDILFLLLQEYFLHPQLEVSVLVGPQRLIVLETQGVHLQ